MYCWKNTLINMTIFITLWLLLIPFTPYLLPEAVHAQEKPAVPSIQLIAPKAGVPVSPRSKIGPLPVDQAVSQGFTYLITTSPFTIKLSPSTFSFTALPLEGLSKAISVTLTTGYAPGFSLWLYQDSPLTSREGQTLPSLTYAYSGSTHPNHLLGLPDISLFQSPAILTSLQSSTTALFTGSLTLNLKPTPDSNQSEGYQNVITLLGVPDY